MTDHLVGNATGFELLFLVSALIGVWFSRQNLAEAWGDHKALNGIANGRRAIALATIIVETLLLSIHSLYIIAALFAVSQPNGNEVSAVGILIQSILVYASWAITAISIVSRRLRRYLNQFGLQPRDEKGRFVSGG